MGTPIFLMRLRINHDTHSHDKSRWDLKAVQLYRSPADRLKEIVYRKKYHKDFVALDNISFEVRNGETLGIIGQNGAGKSTLLKILSGIMIPDSGTIQVNGKVTGLLDWDRVQLRDDRP